jgi:predicted ATPase
MNHITNVSVEGFWETYSFTFRVNRDTTFFIGQNGSGKTTLINLIAAVLTADMRTLAKIPFNKITIAFGPTRAKVSPYVSVNKLQKKNRPFESIEYRILSSHPNAKEVKYTIDEAEEEFFYRHARGEDFPIEYYRRMQRGLLPELRGLFSVNWLSVNRINSVTAAGEKQFESSVDRKIDALSNELVRYFSTLSKRKDDEVRLFQESIFISLLEGTESHAPFDIRLLSNLREYKNTLRNIFKELHVSNNSSDAIIDTFIARAENLSESKYVKSGGAGLLDDAIFASGFKKIESIVQRWDGLQDKLSEIFSQKDKFLSIVNGMLQKKKMEVTEANELQFVSRSGKRLTPHMLSSGEKQLLILLSETLLQREQPTIFIADEPELSLHVLWQERLVASLSSLNPQAQLIVATHSPDIVGPLEMKAIDMETLIQ